MSRKSLKQVLMDRDDMTDEEADNAISEAREEGMNELAEGKMPFDLCDQFGLEPDYLEDFMF